MGHSGDKCLQSLPRQGASALGKRNRYDERNTHSSCLHGTARGEYGRFGVESVEYGLYDKEVYPTLYQRFHLVEVGGGKHVPVKIRVGIANRLCHRQRLARGAYTAPHPYLLAWILLHEAVGSITRKPCGRQADTCRLTLQSVFRQGYRIGVKRVCLYNPCSGIEICRVYFADDIGAGHTQDVVAPFEIDRAVGPLLSAEVALGQRIILNHSAHCAIKHYYSFLN